MEWQPIETYNEQLHGEAVLTYREGGLMAVAGRLFNYQSNKLVWCCTDGVELLNVTHWQPLPSPPSEGSHG
jgi:hypothetical protein